MTHAQGFLLAEKPVDSLEAYVASGGGRALAKALTMPREAIIAEVTAAGLRGRGGAGFPTGVKWDTVARDPCLTKYLVCNGAEGEPGTFKDRMLMRRNPYQLLEGMAIASYAINAQRAFLCLKRSFEKEVAALRRAMAEMTPRGFFGPAPVELVQGPEDVETLCNIPHIVLRGARWFRTLGTQDTPGTMVFTVSGDVVRPGVFELPMGTPLRRLIEEHAGALRPGHTLKAVCSGVSAAVILPSALDTPLDFASFQKIGSGLGSGGFIVFDDTACMVQVAYRMSDFLYVESCGQCTACKFGTNMGTYHLHRLTLGSGGAADLEAALEGAAMAPTGRRCYLPWSTPC